MESWESSTATAQILREVKKRIAENEEDFVSKLREEWKKHA